MQLSRMQKVAALGLILLLVILALSIISIGAAERHTIDTTITVSGTINGPSGGVDNAWIGIRSPADWVETLSDTNGEYSASINTSGELWIHVRPELSTRLTQDNLWLGNVITDVVQDFHVANGHLLDIQVTGNGTPLAQPTSLEVQPLTGSLANDHWHQLDWDGGLQRYRAVLSPDIYYVTADRPRPGYYVTTEAFDLRTNDVVDAMALLTSYVHPIPYDPPVVSKITIGQVDDLGEAPISGSAGAALPLANVLFVNLNSGHQSHAVSEADGSFSGRLFAPPGSSVMIKHGPASWRWYHLDTGVSEMLNPFPGTIVTVPHKHTVDVPGQAFAAAGAVSVSADDIGQTPNTLGAAWAISGTVAPVQVDGRWTRVLSGTYESQHVAGLYLGGLNWTHPALADLDDDDDLDLIIGSNGNQLTLYRNHGSTTTPSWEFEEADFAGVDADWWAYPTFADITNDGRPDLIVGTDDAKVYIYHNTGAGYPASPDTVLAAGTQASPALDDLDDDGDLDMLVGVVDHEEPAHGQLLHFKNTGTITTPTWSLQSGAYASISEPGQWLQPAFVDLGGSSERDLLIGLCGQAIWYEREDVEGTTSWLRHDENPLGQVGGSCGTSFGVGDWSGDGNPDIAGGEHWGNLSLFKNAGPSSWSLQPYELPFDLAGDSAPALADWDDDGDLDMLVGQAHGAVERYTNLGDTNQADWRPDGPLLELPWGNHPHPFPALADIDGDGDYDLFVGEGGWQGPGAGGNIRFYENMGTPETPDWQLVTTNFLGLDVGGWSTPAFADIDNDHDLDLFVGAEDGKITFVENISPTWATPVSDYLGQSLGEHSAPAFLDIDQDNDLDMVVGLSHGSMAYVRNVGDASTPAWEIVAKMYPGVDVGQNAIPTAADLNGDGLSDLMIGDGDGGLNLYLYDGPGSPPAAGDTLDRGDLLHIKGTIHLYSQAITATTDVASIDVFGSLSSYVLADDQGRPLPAQSYFLSSLLTPSGLPIQGSGRPTIGWATGLSVSDLHYAGGHSIEGQFSFTTQIPKDAPAGLHRPAIFLHFNGVPAGNEWISANVTRFTYSEAEALLPPVRIAASSEPRLHWRLLMDDFVQGTRGAVSREESLDMGLASQIVTQGAPLAIPPADAQSNQPIIYRLEPFLPRISFTDRRMPGPPLLPFALPGGELCVAVEAPDGDVRNLGCEMFAQSFNRTKTTRAGQDLNGGTVQMDDVYSLKVASDRFRLSFDQYGHHVITMTGVISDIWGNAYSGGGTYDVWLAEPLDIDPGVLPGTPLAAGDAFNPAMQFYPRGPAQVSLTVTHYPNSDPASQQIFKRSGQANRFGYFGLENDPIVLNEPGEYRVDVSAVYTATDGALYMGAMTWGSVVMTPEVAADLIAHGRRGLDSLKDIPGTWFVAGRDLPIPEGSVSHTLNPYLNGDVLWTRMSDGPYGGDSLVMGASVQEKTANGPITSAIENRFQRASGGLEAPGDLNQRVIKNELPLFISTRSGQPPLFVMRQIRDPIPFDVDQIAYSYRSSQRPGVRVRELVAEEGQSGGYWRLDTLYDDQLSVGVAGDQANDFKFQYIGAVYRDLDAGKNEYLGQGSGWIFIPEEDQLGSRAMPPFSGPGNGGWTREGGPLLTLKGQDVHMFILPTGVLPGAVLEVGDTFHFAGHIMPTLNSQVAVTVTAPTGATYVVDGRANSIGYFYDPDDDFVVTEEGLWSVDVRIWHDGLCCGGSATVPPYPSGDVLGSVDGRYTFYVVSQNASRPVVSAPAPGFLRFYNTVTPITISGPIPAGLTDITVDYTIAMPGFILDQGQATVSGGTYSFIFDPVALNQDYPNLDLTGRDDWSPGLADTIAISFMVTAQSGDGPIHQAQTVTLQGEQVFVPARGGLVPSVFVPLISR